MEPLKKDGVEKLEFRSDADVTVSIEASELPAFDLPELEPDTLLDQETTKMVSIASVHFAEGRKWRLSDGESTFSAAIEDAGFLDRVDKNIEAFRKGDILQCRMHERQFRDETGLHAEYRVLEVMDHIRSEPQLPLGNPDGE